MLRLKPRGHRASAITSVVVRRAGTTRATRWWWTRWSTTSTCCPAASSTRRPSPSSVRSALPPSPRRRGANAHPTCPSRPLSRLIEVFFRHPGNGVVIHLPGLFDEAEKNLQKGKGTRCWDRGRSLLKSLLGVWLRV